MAVPEPSEINPDAEALRHNGTWTILCPWHEEKAKWRRQRDPFEGCKGTVTAGVADALGAHPRAAACSDCGRAVLVTGEASVRFTVEAIDPDTRTPRLPRAGCPDRWHKRDAKLPVGVGDRRCPACHDDGDRTAPLFEKASNIMTSMDRG